MPADGDAYTVVQRHKRRGSARPPTTQVDDDKVRVVRAPQAPLAEAVERVRSAYDARMQESKRMRSCASNMGPRSALNFVKAVLFSRLVARGDAGLDLGCGRGHDVYKWDHVRPSWVAFADLSESSLVEAERRWRRARASFPATFCALDFTQGHHGLEGPLPSLRLVRVPMAQTEICADGEREAAFSVVSCQNALQYAPASPGGLRNALALVASALRRRGGIFFGVVPDADRIRGALAAPTTTVGAPGWRQCDFGSFRVSVQDRDHAAVGGSLETGTPYTFESEDGMRCEQYLVDFGDLVEEAARQGMALQYDENCATWFASEARSPINAVLAQHFKAAASLGEETHRALSLYRLFVFRTNRKR